MTGPEDPFNVVELLDPLRYEGRVEPNHFDYRVHTAGAIDWLTVMDNDPAEFAASLDEFMEHEGFRPLTSFSEPYTPPQTFDEVERYSAALAFLKSQGVSESLVESLNAQMLNAVQTSSDTELLLAVITSEALARGEYDPFQLIYNGVIMQAGDF